MILAFNRVIISYPPKSEGAVVEDVVLVTAEVAEVVAVAESPKERGFAAELDAAGVVEVEVVADVPNENVGFGTREVGRDQLVTFFENLQQFSNKYVFIG